MWDKRAKNVSVYDGDTLTMVIDQGFRDTKEITIRLFGVFAPELKQTGGPETRAFVQKWLSEMSIASSSSWPYVVTTIRGPRSDREVTTLERYVCLVESGGRNLNVDIAAFLAEQGYTGGVGYTVPTTT